MFTHRQNQYSATQIYVLFINRNNVVKICKLLRNLTKYVRKSVCFNITNIP